MILNVDPVAHIHPIAINRNRFVVHRIRERERQKLFGKLSWSIVVSAARDNRVESESVMGGTNEVLRRSLGSGVGTIGLKRRGLSKEAVVVFRQTSHHFVGRHCKTALLLWPVPHRVEPACP